MSSSRAWRVRPLLPLSFVALIASQVQAQYARTARVAVTRQQLASVPPPPPPEDLAARRRPFVGAGALVGVVGGLGAAIYGIHNGGIGDLGFIAAPLIFPIYMIGGGAVGMAAGYAVSFVFVH